MGIKEDLENLLTPVITGENYELVELQYRKEGKGWVLRIYVDKPGGITLDNCVELNEKLGRFLDEKYNMPYRYTLEVSSPGLDRRLKKESDFQKFVGHLVKITLYAPEEGQRYYLGRIRETKEGKVCIETFSEKDKCIRVIEIPLNNVASARLEIEM